MFGGLEFASVVVGGPVGEFLVGGVDGFDVAFVAHEVALPAVLDGAVL